MQHHDCPIFPDDDLLDRIHDELEAGARYPWPEQSLHLTSQDTACAPWIRLLDLIEHVEQVWHSLPVGMDILPLLANACSRACIDSRPDAPDSYIQRPHHGGLSQTQAGVEW